MLDVKKLRETAADYSKFGYGSRVCLDPDSVNELLDRLEAAEQERDEAQRITRAALEQRDALSAHVERLIELLERSQTGLDWYRDAYPEADSGTDDEHEADVKAAIAQAPETSLARHDIDLLAELIQEAKDECLSTHLVVELKLGRLRRQAEEQNHDQR